MVRRFFIEFLQVIFLATFEKEFTLCDNSERYY